MKIHLCDLIYVKGVQRMQIKEVVCGGDTPEQVLTHVDNASRGLRHLTPPNRVGWELKSVTIIKELGTTNEEFHGG